TQLLGLSSFSSSSVPRALPSFPTRRSSDLCWYAASACGTDAPAVGLGAGDGYACGLTGRRPADASGRTVAARQDQRIQWNLHPLSSIPDPASADLGRTGAGPAASAVPWCRCLEQL